MTRPPGCCDRWRAPYGGSRRSVARSPTGGMKRPGAKRSPQVSRRGGQLSGNHLRRSRKDYAEGTAHGGSCVARCRPTSSAPPLPTPEPGTVLPRCGAGPAEPYPKLHAARGERASIMSVCLPRKPAPKSRLPADTEAPTTRTTAFAMSTSARTTRPSASAPQTTQPSRTSPGLCAGSPVARQPTTRTLALDRRQPLEAIFEP